MAGFLGQTWLIVTTIVALGLVVLALVLLHLRRSNARLKGFGLPGGFRVDFDHQERPPVASSVPPASVKIPQIFDKSDSTAFTACAEELLKDAKRVVLIGTGLNLLQRDPIFNALAQRAARGDCEVEVFMANPWSPDVTTRLIEEELGPDKPPIGPEGLVLRLTTILHKLKTLGWPARFSLSLFWNYPTFALGIIDGHYFSYSYGFALLGNFSPVEHYTKESKEHLPMIEFFEKQYERVKQASVDARVVLGLHRHELDEHVSVDRLKSFAVYLVPPLDSPLYRFGTSVLGYDIRQRCRVDTRWRAEVGAAAQFGMHLTVADALYFAGRGEIERVQKELEFVLKNFPKLWLTDLELEPGFPDQRSISIRCRDRRGALDALHHEMVATVYRRAIASNYTLGLAGRRHHPDDETQLMLSRYGAPYVLSRFRPHFSLLTDVDPARVDETATEVRDLFRDVPRQIEIERVALMSQPSPGSPWQIEREISLH